MSRKRWRMRFISRAAAAATLSAQSTAGRVRAMPTRAHRNQPIFQSHHCLPPNKRLNDGTMKEALNPDEDRDRDFAQSFRPPCRQHQDQPAGSGPAASQDMETAKPGKRSNGCRPGFVLGSVPRHLKPCSVPAAPDYRFTCRNGVPAPPHRQGWCSDTRPGDRLPRARG